jgi:hypothetical protein
MRLFRAVSVAELENLRLHGGVFRDSIHLTGEKGFFFNLDDAVKLASSLERMLGEAHIVVMTDASDTVVARNRKHEAAQEGPGVYLQASDWIHLSPAEEAQP